MNVGEKEIGREGGKAQCTGDTGVAGAKQAAMWECKPKGGHILQLKIIQKCILGFYMIFSNFLLLAS